MPVLEFQDESRFQDYPLEEESPTMLDTSSNVVSVARDWLLDAGFVLGVGSGAEILDQVRLISIVDTGTAWRFTLKAGTSGDEIDVDYDRNVDEPGVTKLLDTGQDARFRGFIQFGNLSSIPGDLSGDVKFIKTLVEYTHENRATSIKIANQVATVPWDEECQGTKPSYADYKKINTTVNGEVALRSGRNIEILQIQDKNQLSIGVTSSPNAGGEPPCGDSLEVYPTGVAIEEDSCNEVLSTINGIAPSQRTKTITFSGSRGISFDQGVANEIVLNINTPVLFKRNQQGS